MTTFSPTEAAKRAGVGASTVRNHGRRFAKYFSPGIHERPRRYSLDDVKLIAFIASHSANGETYERIEQRLAAGEMEDFQFTAVTTERTVEATAPGLEDENINVSRTTFQLIQAQLNDLRIRENEAVKQLNEERGENRRLRDTISELREQIGKLEGQLGEIRRSFENERPKSFWQRIFGS